MSGDVITRFAPSPTGFLHIGGARTALFNWLYAKNRGGKMLLRIEDTDRSRHSDEAVEAILDGLQWLGLSWDGEPISQYARVDRHRAIAEELVKSGNAYYCYATPKELEAMREKARAEGRPPRYDGRWRDRDPSEAPSGVKPAIRIKASRDGVTVVADRVQGDVSFPNGDLDDFIILRSDGNPTYMLAVVVDDHDMGVTDIIRGDDHLTNAARQTVIYHAMKWPVPTMAHIPLIHGPDGGKLSKRHGALGAEAYRAMGYLPEALCNYLVRLGWSHGDDEIISMEQMIEWFDIADVNKGAARFDVKKLEAINGHYIRNGDDDTLTEALCAFFPHMEGGDYFEARKSDEKVRQLREAMPGLKERARTLSDLADGARFLFAERPLNNEDKAEKILSEGGRDTLSKLLPLLETAGDWRLETLETVIRDFADAEELKLGKVAQPLRAALTGRTTSPGVFDVIAVLGRDEALGRIKDQLA
ncbi:glutamate--tRNA ligase [Hoeflea prorocentri]|uniref:Glutamate--tRNA ligase n=1 Tax=Hoeflea prorocentri TaxID=1922333 RepID=A0A9X3ZHE4_9HYPH|nr:glutamate--tRNA ligase [Hoeflea prorocentri]MCY6380685.1 glutamate--tRNA ligase [Hoeflea prorocentri]MDA5398485.1 glutamate--tRNA ligase [Hoeflea prorocentri]